MNNRINNNDYICPRCKSKDILEFDDFISCNKCNLDFDKEFLGVIDNENILARQEKKGIIDAFDENDDDENDDDENDDDENDDDENDDDVNDDDDFSKI